MIFISFLSILLLLEIIIEKLLFIRRRAVLYTTNKVFKIAPAGTTPEQNDDIAKMKASVEELTKRLNKLEQISKLEN